MQKKEFKKKLHELFEKHRGLIERKNEKLKDGNGIFDRYRYPILTGEHTPIFWRYDLNYETNPHLMEREV